MAAMTSFHTNGSRQPFWKFQTAISQQRIIRSTLCMHVHYTLSSGTIHHCLHIWWDIADLLFASRPDYMVSRLLLNRQEKIMCKEYTLDYSQSKVFLNIIQIYASSIACGLK